MVSGELQEARGNVESLLCRVKKWSAKLAECRRRGDLTGGGHASERVFEGNRRVREAQKAVEVLEGGLQGMGGGVQVKQEGGSTTMRLWSWVRWWWMRRMKSGGLTRGLRERKKRGGGEGDGDGEGEGDDAGGVLRITDWMRNRLGSSLAAKAANFPWTREMVGPNPPPPPGRLCPTSPPPHHLHAPLATAALLAQAAALQGAAQLPLAPGGGVRAGGGPGVLGDRAGDRAHGTPPQRLAPQQGAGGQISNHGLCHCGVLPLAPHF